MIGDYLRDSWRRLAACTARRLSVTHRRAARRPFMQPLIAGSPCAARLAPGRLCCGPSNLRSGTASLGGPPGADRSEDGWCAGLVLREADAGWVNRSRSSSRRLEAGVRSLPAWMQPVRQPGPGRDGADLRAGIGVEPIAGLAWFADQGPHPLPSASSPRATSVPAFPVAPITVMVMNSSVLAGTGTGRAALAVMRVARCVPGSPASARRSRLPCLPARSGRSGARGTRRPGGR